MIGMASLPNLFARPRLQLLALIVVFGAVLPKNSMAQDGEVAEVEVPAPGRTNDAGVAATEGPGPTDTSTETQIPPVTCWVQFCRSDPDAKFDSDPDPADIKIGSESDCLKHPGALGAKKESCPSGYCFQLIQHGYKNDIKWSKVERHCADPWEPPCFQDKPDKCLRWDLTREAERKKDAELQKCVEDAEKAVPESRRFRRRRRRRYGGSSSSKPTPKNTGVAARCVCNTDLCNDRTSSAPTGVKHLGWNVALLGAVLGTVFPLLLRKVFLLG